MSSTRIYRVLARTSSCWYIDLPAADDEAACIRAEALWNAGGRHRFGEIRQTPLAEFTIDEDATHHLADELNAYRSEWAQKALRVFSAETGVGTSAEGVSELICDLGHYADERGIDFAVCVERARGSWMKDRQQPRAIENAQAASTVKDDEGEP